MNILLGIANAALSYARGRETGIIGLFAIGIAILAVRYWNKIMPFFDAIGLVDLYYSLGFGSDAYYMNWLHVFVFLTILSLTIMALIAIFLILVLGIMILLDFLPDKVKMVLAVILLLPLAPFFAIYVFYMSLRLKLDKGYRLRYLAKHNIDEKQLKMTAKEALLKEHSTEIPREHALARLNRIPTRGDDLFLLGVDAENKLYVLLPRPINVEWPGKYKKNDVYAVEYSVEWYRANKHKPKSSFLGLPVPEPKLFYLTRPSGFFSIISLDNVVKFYQTTSVDMLRKFKHCSLNFEDHIKEIQNHYFETKEWLIEKLKNTLDKEEFDRLTELAKQFNASNEDIVKIMFDNVRR